MIDLKTRLRDVPFVGFVYAEQHGLEDPSVCSEAANRIELLEALLHEAAADLTAYVLADYPLGMQARYPGMARRYERDMELVRRIEAALEGETT